MEFAQEFFFDCQQRIVTHIKTTSIEEKGSKVLFALDFYGLGYYFLFWFSISLFYHSQMVAQI